MIPVELLWAQLHMGPVTFPGIRWIGWRDDKVQETLNFIQKTIVSCIIYTYVTYL